MPRTLPFAAGAAALALALPAGAAARPADAPEVLPLPTGYQPEGIDRYDGDEVLVGSIPTGALTRIDVQDGTTTVLSPATPGRSAIGIEVADGRVFVAGGATGKVRVHDARTGEVIRELQASVAGEPTFVNDVVVSGGNAYFTDSRAPKLYVLPVAGGPLEVLPVTGEFEQVPGVLNLNGIVAKGPYLVAVSQGRLFRIEKATGEARLITLRGIEDVVNGDGLLLEGRTLSVVQNRRNTISQLTLSPDLLTATLVRQLTDDDLEVPTTVARVGNALFSPNAKFGIATPAQQPFEVVRVDGSAR